VLPVHARAATEAASSVVFNLPNITFSFESVWFAKSPERNPLSH
jgi:hypothetical protein